MLIHVEDGERILAFTWSQEEIDGYSKGIIMNWLIDNRAHGAELRELFSTTYAKLCLKTNVRLWSSSLTCASGLRWSLQVASRDL